MNQKTRDGILKAGKDGQDRVLEKLYSNAAGRLILKPLTAPWISRLAGCLLSTGASRVLIAPFIRSNGIDMSQFEDIEYKSYNECL